MIVKIIEDIKRFEGFRSRVYRCPAGKLTIGYGRNLEDNGVTQGEAERLLLSDLVRFIAQLDKQVSFWKSQPVPVRAVLLEMAYQLGVGGLLGFKKFLQALRCGDYETAQKEILDSRWARQTPSRAEYLARLLMEKSESGDEARWERNVEELRRLCF